ncbi:MAG TPA: HAMP domain-containing sensor histidine kinase [Conexibacter sp.]|jgi:two-component system OmpR family sensor kinase|nr:HAMP domain-containing sensor histidine kinase [Conexibacter sp.]
MSRRAGPARILGLRGRLLGFVTLAVAAGIAVVLVAFNLVLDAQLDRDAHDLARSRATAALAGVQLLDGRLRVRETLDEAVPFDQPIWIFAGHGALERPRADASVQRAAAALAGGPERTLDVPGASVRLLALPVAHAGRRAGTVVAGVSLTPYERTKHAVLVASLALGGLLLGIAVLAARWLLAAGLRPVARMTADAAAWSEHDLDRRFAAGPPHDELTQLAATLDDLLDRLADGLRREQRFTEELSHELRTPLARLRARSQLALDGDPTAPQTRTVLEAVIRDTDAVTRTLDALLTAARAHSDGAGSADARSVARSVLEDCAAVAESHGVALRLDGDGDGAPARIRVTSELAERTLHPLVENACRHAAREVRIALRRDDGMLLIEVTDDGPGVAAGEQERIFQPGARSDEADAGAAGLGLALARRLARAAGGDVEAHPGPDGRFVVRLPGG